MISKDWKFVFRRRGWSLSSYISKCKTINEVEEKFKNAKLTMPSGKELAEAGWGFRPENEAATFTHKTTKIKKDTSRKKLARTKKKIEQNTKNLQGEVLKYDELIIVETEE